MLKQISRLFLVFLLVLGWTLYAPISVSAADIRSGDNVTVAAGETITGDLYIAGNSISILGTVNGDVFAAGRSVKVSGVINGGLTAAAQNIEVSGRMSAGARLAGQMITVSGSTGRDLVVAGSDVNIQNNAVVGGDLVSTVATLRHDGTVRGNILGSGNQITVNGNVDGNINTDVNTLVIAPAANIRGNIVYTSPNDARIEPGAQIGGSTSRTPRATEPREIFPFWRVITGIIGFLMSLVTGIILILLLENNVALVSDAIGYSLLGSLGWGALILFVTPLVAIAVIITIVGIPAGIILLISYGIAIYFSQIFFGLFLGRVITRQFERPVSRASLIGALAIGLLIITVLQLLPYIGWLISLAIIIFGLGALIVAARTPENQIISGY